MKRLDSIQMLRGVAALVVVMFHISTLSNDYVNGILFEPFTLIGNAGVDLFFVISGFVMTATTYDTFDAPGAPARFAIHRLSRIYPPYWFLSALVFAYYLYNPAGVNAKHGGVDLAASFWLTPSRLLPLVPVAWTLMHEVIFYTVFFVALCILPHRRIGVALWIWAGLVALNTLTSLALPGAALSTFLLHPFNLEFIGGALIGLHYRSRGAVQRSRAITATTLAVVLFVMAAVHLQSTGPSGLASVETRIGLFAAPSMLLVVGCLGLRLASQSWTRPITRMGDYSYSLYLTHILVIHFAYRLMTKLPGKVVDLWTAIPLAITLLSICIWVGQIFFRSVEKPLCAAFVKGLTELLDRKRSAAAQDGVGSGLLSATESSGSLFGKGSSK